MNEIKLFDNTEFGEVSIMVIDGKEYFLLSNVLNFWGIAIHVKLFLTTVKRKG